MKPNSPIKTVKTNLVQKSPGIRPLLFLILFTICLPFLSSASTSPKLHLKAGDTFYYQMQTNQDTHIETKWYKFEVIEKTDTLYKIECTNYRAKSYGTEYGYDTRDGYRSSSIPSMLNNLLIDIPLTFMVSESGHVQPFYIPDQLLYEKVKETTESNLLTAYGMIQSYRGAEKTFQSISKRFFVDLRTGRTTEKINNGLQTNTITLKPGTDNEYNFSTRFQVDSSQIANEDNVKDYYFPVLLSSTTEGILSIENKTGMIKQSEFTASSLSKIVSPDQTMNMPSKSLVSIKRELPPQQSVILTGEVSANYTGSSLKCFMFHNFLEYDIFEAEEKLFPGGHFRIEKKLSRPIGLTLSLDHFPLGFSTLLLESGDSIHLEISNNGVVFSGKGALKNQINRQLMSNSLNLDHKIDELSAKNLTSQKTKEQLEYLNQHKDSISDWAYDQLKSNIYYGNLNRLISYYYDKNGGKVNEKSFNVLFDKIEWNEYCSVASLALREFVDTYLFRKMLILKKYETNRWMPDMEYYFLAEMIFQNQKVKYLAKSLITYRALKDNDISKGEQVFRLYEKDYKGSEFYERLKEKFANKVNLGLGQPTPDFTVTDINGKQVSLNDLKGKYVQLLFVNLEHEADIVSEYQKMKAELPNDKFELITIFVNKDDSLTNAYIKEHHPKGILIKNPGWQIEQLKKFDSESTASYYLINPIGIIVFPGSGEPTGEIVKVLIEMISNAQYNKAEASVSARTLYWVLAVSGFLLLLAVSLLVIIPRRIRKREAANREQLDLKLKAVRSQLNPHFLFNSMNSIQYLVNKNETEKANLFLSKFAQLMRKVLNQSEVELVPLKDELETITTYLELEALRHQFKFEIRLGDDVDIFNIEIPVMLLQPFVENAIIHGISEKGKEGLIEIEVQKVSKTRMMIVISDNGNGIQQKINAPQQSNGRGIQITQQRINLIMANYEQKIDFKIQDRKREGVNGTKVVITFSTEA